VGARLGASPVRPYKFSTRQKILATGKHSSLFCLARSFHQLAFSAIRLYLPNFNTLPTHHPFNMLTYSPSLFCLAPASLWKMTLCLVDKMASWPNDLAPFMPHCLWRRRASFVTSTPGYFVSLVLRDRQPGPELIYVLRHCHAAAGEPAEFERAGRRSGRRRRFELSTLFLLLWPEINLVMLSIIW
jgi:hypothetical protein